VPVLGDLYIICDLYIIWFNALTVPQENIVIS